MRIFWLYVTAIAFCMAGIATLKITGWPGERIVTHTKIAQPCRGAYAMGDCLQGSFLTLAHGSKWAKPLAASECRKPRNGHYVCRQFVMANDQPACFLLDVVRAPSGTPVELQALQAPLMACAKLVPKES